MKTERLNTQDEYFLDTDTPTAPTHIGGLEIYRPPKGAGRDYVRQLHEYLRKSPVRAPPFNCKLVSISPESGPRAGRSLVGRLRGVARLPAPTTVRAWAQVDDINIDEHIFFHVLPRAGGQRELGELVARLHISQLDRSRPLWEVHLIEGLEGNRYAIYTKLHHSQFDGKRGMELQRFIRSTDPSVRGMPPIWAVDPRRAARPAKARSKPAARPTPPPPGTLETLASWGTALQTVAEARLVDLPRGVIPPYSAPATILNGPLTPRRRLGTQSLSIPRLKAIGAAVPGGATVNEVLLATCGGALRRYLKEQKALPKAPLIAACPVAHARKDDKASGNAVGQILVSLATNVADPKRRLVAVAESSRANKGLMHGLDPDTYTHYTMLSMMPQALAAKTRFAHKLLNANLVISNVPGPRERQYVNGARLEAMYATSLLLAGQALNITVSNFGDNLDMGVLACPDLCPSPQRIAVYAGEELGVLERALRIRPRTRQRAGGQPAGRAGSGKTALRKAATRRGKAVSYTKGVRRKRSGAQRRPGRQGGSPAPSGNGRR